MRQKNYNKNHQVYQFHQNRSTSPYDGPNSWIDGEKLIYVYEIESKTVYKAEDEIDREKEVRHLLVFTQVGKYL